MIFYLVEFFFKVNNFLIQYSKLSTLRLEPFSFSCPVILTRAGNIGPTHFNPNFLRIGLSNLRAE